MGLFDTLGSVGGYALGGPLGSAIGGALGGAGDTIFGINQTNNANQAANNQYWERWNANNEYNSPAAQMERYKKAGLNPNLIYGNGASAVEAKSSATPEVKIPEIGSARGLEAFQQLALTQARTAEVEANRRLLQAREGQIDYENRFTEARTKSENEFRQPTVNKLLSEKQLTDILGDKAMADIAEAESRTKRLDTLTPLDAKKTRAETKKIKAETFEQVIKNKYAEGYHSQALQNAIVTFRKLQNEANGMENRMSEELIQGAFNRDAKFQELSLEQQRVLLSTATLLLGGAIYSDNKTGSTTESTTIGNGAGKRTTTTTKYN